MATYAELRSIFGSAEGDEFRKKVEVAVAIKAQTLIDGTPTAGQLAWAQEALEDPSSKATVVMNYMISVNKGLAIASITGAADASIQTNTNSAIDALVS